MKAKTLLAWALLGVFIAMSAPCALFAQEAGPAATVTFSRQELDQMLAPIALYPDSLLAQILIAATFPDQVMDADRWLKENPGLSGRELNDALNGMDWDLSVKALAPFPQVLDMMAQEPDWTQQLGEAFLAQQPDVMDSVQRLRRRAQAAGNLRSTPQQRVVVADDSVQIEPVDPELVYIPRYDPLVVYGTWWWPAYPPFAYYPVWSGPAAFAPVVGVFGFWGAITVGPAWGWGWGYWGWGSHAVFLNVDRRFDINTRNAMRIDRMRRNYRIARVRNMAMAGRIGSARVRTRAFGRRIANPAALHGHITSARIRNGRVVSRARGIRPGFTGRGVGRTPAGVRSGFRGRGFHGARPSAAEIMHELRGGGAGHGFRGRAGSYGNARARGSFGQQRSNRSFGQRPSNRSFGQQRSNRSFGQQPTNRSFGQQRSNRSFGQQRFNRSSGGFRGAARGNPGGFAAGGRRGGSGGAPRGAQRGGGHNGHRR